MVLNVWKIDGDKSTVFLRLVGGGGMLGVYAWLCFYTRCREGTNLLLEGGYNQQGKDITCMCRSGMGFVVFQLLLNKINT